MSKYASWENQLYPSLIENIEYICSNISDDGVLYDIGANTGLLSSKVLEKKPDIKIVLFEPIKNYYNSAVEKFKNNKNVLLYNIALIDNTDSIEMSVDRSNLGWNTISEIRDYGEKEIVNGTTLSNIVSKQNIPLPDFIKIDVEESEQLVIEGARTLFNKHIPKNILIESGISNGHRLWNKQVDMFEYLFSLGYKRFDYNNKGTFDARFEL
jgi:FkbM family methyltransferase